MGARVVLRPTSLAVEPGGEAICEVDVQNVGNVVDEFTVEVVGDAAQWSTPDPATVSLMPAGQSAVRVRISPPRSSAVPAGSLPFGVKVSSREDPGGTVTEEGTLEVGSFSDLSAELVPRTARGRRSARHEVALDNRGNASTSVTLEAIDPDEQMGFEIDPAVVDSAPGTATFAKLRARPRKSFLRGPAKTLPFKVLAHPEGGVPMSIDGNVLQEALLPKWLPAAAALVALAVLGWFFLLKPTVTTLADEAAKRETAPVIDTVNTQGQAIDKLNDKVDPDAPDVPEVPTSEATPTPDSGVENVTGVPFDGERFDERLALVAGRDGARKDYPVPDGQTLSVTDLIFQNPNGASGTLDVKRGSEILVRVRLENFRDLDYHFITPLVFREGEVLRAAASCAGGSKCSVAVYVVGFVQSTS
jgi:hypothetical protein